MKKTFVLSLIAVSVFSMGIVYSAEAYMNGSTHRGSYNSSYANNAGYTEGNTSSVATQTAGAPYTHRMNRGYRSGSDSMNGHNQNSRMHRTSGTMQHSNLW